MVLAAERSPSRTLPDAALTFLPADPPRRGTFFLYRPGGPRPGEELAESLECILPTRTGATLRRRAVPGRAIPVADALGGGLSGDGAPVAGAEEWAAVVTAALGLIARGRLHPAVTSGGHDAWRVGPLTPADRRLLGELAAALPPTAHAAVCGDAPGRRVSSPLFLVEAVLDAVADTLVRTAAAPAVLGARTDTRAPVLFAAEEPGDASHLRPWLVEATGGLAGARGADVALRVEIGDHGEDALVGDAGGEGEDAPPGRAVLQLTSRADPSLIVDAADLYASPAAVVARFGDDAEADLLRALRRGARAWPPLGPLLHERAPAGLTLDEDLLGELLAEGATALTDAGIEVLWPAEIMSDGLALRASIVATPGMVTEGGLNLDTLVDFSWQVTLQGEVLSAEEVDQLAEAKRALVRLRGRFVAADPALLERLRSRRRRRLSAAEALASLLAGSIEVDGESVEVVADGPLAELAQRLRSLDGAKELPRPPGLADGVELRPYQRRGVAWLSAMVDSGLGGCLADDMGLGKTLQVLALHLHRAARDGGPTLVICPTSLLGNWEREARRFAPGLALRRHHGTGRDLEGIGAGELVVTSYGIARRDATALAAVGFTLVVADEAQHAKNPETATARALRRIGGPARLALSGTPVENRLSDLWSLLDWTTPGLLGPFDRFLRQVATPIERDHDAAATERLGRIIRPFLLRRRKSDPEIAPDLPARTVSDLAVPLSSEQATLYEAVVREALAAIRDEDGVKRQGLVLKMLTVLKQICNHPAQYLHQRGPLAGRSGKLAALEELVDVIGAEGESVLIFSQFVECLTLIESRLGELGVQSLFLHGKVPARQRSSIVDAFQAGAAPVLLLSLKAGGVGLNLTRATHVVHFDRWWNPAVEEQATDRAHRIGQDRPVQVHRLIAEGTLEDRIAMMIENKRALAESVVGAGESWIGQMSNDELAELVALGGPE